MEGQGPLVIVLLLFVRLLAPLALLLALGTLYERWSSRRSADHSEIMPASRRNNWPAASELSTIPNCWEIIECSPEQRALCPAAKRRGVPCWLTMQLIEGRLPERCLDCQVFKDSAPLSAASD